MSPETAVTKSLRIHQSICNMKMRIFVERSKTIVRRWNNTAEETWFQRKATCIQFHKYKLAFKLLSINLFFFNMIFSNHVQLISNNEYFASSNMAYQRNIGLTLFKILLTTFTLFWPKQFCKCFLARNFWKLSNLICFCVWCRKSADGAVWRTLLWQLGEGIIKHHDDRQTFTFLF